MNLPDDAQWFANLGWVVMAFCPIGPYPVLIVDGEAGSAKTTHCRMNRMLIDPCCVPLRRPPQNDRDLLIAASNAWLVAYDNMSGVGPALSDTLCSVASGAGFGSRALYTDDSEKLLAVARPVMMNGIDELTSRGDLLDRSVRLHLPPIPADRRKPETEIYARFELLRPGALGRLLDGVASALANYGRVVLPASPRMADFARWATAAEPALGLPAGSIMEACRVDRQDVDAAAIEASPIGPTLTRFMLGQEQWTGTASSLMSLLGSEQFSTEADRRNRDWPRSASYLSNLLKRLAPHLRRQGIEFSRLRAGRDGARTIILARVNPEVPFSHPAECCLDQDRRQHWESPSASPSAENPLLGPENAVADGTDGTDGDFSTPQLHKNHREPVEKHIWIGHFVPGGRCCRSSPAVRSASSRGIPLIEDLKL